ncbi:SIMPL domain-containing protein [Streptomyces sp. H10-C2]|uniref:SIMPL domain-containing protein n=1 Tax=unclassified Streptomyces TaxID=2593676 RepID=UPI0024BB2906|nr:MULTISPECIES: SIMPL domain-containing protein [unclassified Streptomyces]MDJ0344490.1 SIMPL domain-containing protein [Streptomyces sp. PH10-H1]MDJ0369636.1 SIMPL domain-containing protein [Streptomyces sp. H10-C2]
MTAETDRTYPTPAAPHVGVRGEATIEVEPELARISVTVKARGADRRHTLDDLTRRNTQALDLIKGYGDAIENLETGTFYLAPELRERGRDRGEKIRAYHGTVRIGATLTDFTALGELTTRLADLELTAVDGPWWSLRPQSPAYREARRQAVRDALQRGREYAEALGATLTALIELADEGVHQATPYPKQGFAGMSTRAVAAPGTADMAPQALDLEPERQSVYAHVTAHFTMTPPDLG